MLEQAIPAARAEISAVTNFITTRRGAIGSEARTRLDEAQRHLDAGARAGPAPIRSRALTAAQQADALAEQAGQLANNDVNELVAAAFRWRGGVRWAASAVPCSAGSCSTR